MGDGDDLTFGLYLNLGANLAPTAEGVFALTERQARLADDLGYHDLWVTEHHFIRFGINPSALTAAGYLLGRTERIRVGTAVTLSPLSHPVELAERTALLDQLSGGRFDLGIGRGGYRLDYEVLDVDFARWDDEPRHTAEVLLDLWRAARRRSAPDGGGDGVVIQPPPRSDPHPPLLMGTSTGVAIDFAARNGLALQHYFATPVANRVAIEERYDRSLRGSTAPAHLHALLVVVADDEPTVRDRLAAALTQSFVDGDHPHVPQAPERHVGADGAPLDRRALARIVADAALVGSPARIVDELGAFVEQTGARRLALYTEATADPELTMTSIERFAAEVAPQLASTT